MIIERRSTPMRTLSLAFSKSSISTSFLFCRAAQSAASFTRFARSAPEKPGVPRAIMESSTSSDIGTLRVCTRRISSRPLTSGRATTTRRSKRPGRNSAGSSTSGRFVAAIKITPSFDSNPSISTSNAFSVCSRSSCPPPRPAPRWRPTASISSMKMMHGAFFLPCSKRSRTRLAPTPTNISTKSEPEIEKNGTFASPAIALANNVLPVPGGPTSSTPFGIRPPSFWNFCGSFRNSMISCSSSLASSVPATSLNVAFFCCAESSRARDLPKLNALFPPDCICRIRKRQRRGVQQDQHPVAAAHFFHLQLDRLVPQGFRDRRRFFLRNGDLEFHVRGLDVLALQVVAVRRKVHRHFLHLARIDLGHPHAIRGSILARLCPVRGHQLPEHHAQKDDRDPKENCFCCGTRIHVVLTNPATCRKKIRNCLFLPPLDTFPGRPIRSGRKLPEIASHPIGRCKAVTNPHLVRCRSEAKVIRLQGYPPLRRLIQKDCQPDRARLAFAQPPQQKFLCHS